MRYLFIYKYSNIFGGIQEIIRKLGKFLISRGSRVYILTNHSVYKEKKYSFEEGLEIFYCNKKNICRFLFEKELDIICIFEPYKEFIFLAWLFKIIKKNISNVLIFCGSKTENPGRIFKLLFLLRLIFRIFDTFVAVSEYVRRKCFKGKFLEKVKVIYPPIEISNYKKTDFKRNNLIAIGRICKRKGYEDLIEIFEKIHQYQIGKKLTLDIIGGLEECNTKYFSYLKQLIKMKKLEKFVNFYINISNEKKLELLSHSKLFITTSKHEMFGISTVEAMASGIPIIAYSNTATQEICSLGGQILVEDGNKEKAVKEILNLLSDENRIKILSENAKKTSLHFDSKRTFGLYFKLFTELSHQQYKKQERFKSLKFEEKVKKYMKSEAGFVWQRFNEVRVKRVLDIGCGEGIFLATKPEYVIGIDKDPKLVNLCRKRGLPAIVVDIEREKFPFSNNSFGGVVMMRILEHLYYPDKVLLEVNRVLKMNGLLFIIVPTKEHENYWRDYSHVRPYTIEALQMLAKDTGFEIDEYFYTGNGVPLWGKLKLTQYINPAKLREKLGVYHKRGNIWAILRKCKDYKELILE